MYPSIHLPLLGVIPTFYLVISIAILIGLRFIHSREAQFSFSPELLSNLNLILIVSSFLGARFLHIVYEEPQHYLQFPKEIFFFWQGGFVFYGGFLFAVMAGLSYLKFFLKKSRFEILKLLDFYALPAALVYSIGRIGCFLNGCCYGTESSAWFALFGRFPSQLITAVIEFLILLFCIFLEKKRSLKPGELFFIWLSLHALNRIGMEITRVDFRGPFFLLSLSTWISLILFGMSIYQLYRSHDVSK